MGQLVRVRGLTEQEGQKLQHIVRRGSTSSVRFRRAMMLLASASGSTVPVIARLVQADEDTVRDLIHKFNEIGLACLEPRSAGGRPRFLDRDDEDFVVQTATTRPTVLGKPFTRWSIRKLADHLSRNFARPVRIGREALRCLLARRGISFQRTKTWKESPDADFDAQLARIEYAINEQPDRTFAFDEFDRWAPARPPAHAGQNRVGQTDCRRRSAELTGSPISTLFLRLRRPNVGDQPAPQGHRPYLGGPANHPGRPPGRHPDPRDPR
nr:helix-turn-helix domain-containing protein [Actinospica acidiphila]